MCFVILGCLCVLWQRTVSKVYKKGSVNCVCIVESRPTQVWVTGEGAVVRLAGGCHSILAVWSSHWSTQSNLEPSWLLWTLMDDQSQSSCHSAFCAPLIGRLPVKGRVTMRTTSVSTCHIFSFSLVTVYGWLLFKGCFKLAWLSFMEFILWCYSYILLVSCKSESHSLEKMSKCWQFSV